MKLELEIPDEWLERFKKVRIPEEHCGPTIEEIAVFWIDHQLCCAEGEAAERERSRLYRSFGMKSPRDEMDDGPDF